MKKQARAALAVIGYPRLIIGGFLIFISLMAVVLRLPVDILANNILVRFGMNGVLVLALVPAIQVGTGLNFALPLGIVCGLAGAVICIELRLTGALSFLVALLISVPVSILVGYLYGLLLNRIKGQEMTVGTYVGFSVVSGMCIFWLLAPFKSPEMVWAYGGTGLRNTILLESSFDKVLNNFLKFNIGRVEVPTGLLVFFALLCFGVWFFGRTRTGLAMTTAGANPRFAQSCGINVNRMRMLGIIISTVLACVGILVFSQSYGFLQLYQGPLYMAFPAVASILIGGATVKRAGIFHVLLGTFLFQSLLVVALPVINALVQGSFSEIFRIIISNGIIIYALTSTTGGESNERKA